VYKKTGGEKDHGAVMQVNSPNNERIKTKKKEILYPPGISWPGSSYTNADGQHFSAQSSIIFGLL